MTNDPRFLKADAIVDFPASEEAIRAIWKERRIFEKSIEQRQGKEWFVWHDGPPTANGKPHNGHALTRVFKDIFPRYRAMRGYYVPRKAGWDTHGLPVEVEVEKELGIHGKAEIEAYGVEAFIKKCMESVFRYTRDWERMTEQMGHWVDLDEAYVTYHKSYVESVWWALSELFDQNLLYQGHKVVWWWAQGGTALSSAEVGLGYKTVDDPSVYVAFPLVDEPDTSLLVWTTTPWTLPSNMYAAVKPDIDYVVVEDSGRKLVVAAALREAIGAKLGRELPVVRELKGEALLEKRYRPPFADYFDRLGNEQARTKSGEMTPLFWKVLAADFVELDQGTGLVHEAPAFGEVDHDLHREVVAQYEDPASVPLLCAIGPDGKFTDEVPSLSGKWVKDADKDIVRHLKDSGLLVHQETYRHEYPFCWRADDDPLIQFARPAWFIRTTALIDSAIANNRAVNWIPEHIKEGRFGDFLANNVDWALSRERYWGTPLNIWVNDVTGRMVAPRSVAEILKKNPNAFASFAEAKKKNPDLSEHLIVHKPWIDDVTFEEPGEEGTYRRVPEVIDCWFDSGSMPFAQWGYPHTGKEIFDEMFPADFIVEAIDQTRGWFYSLLMISTLVFDRPYPHPYETCIVLGHVNDREGKKESKSKGNYTPPEVILEKVAMDFAVVESDEAQEGKVLIAREDLEGLDLRDGARVQLYRPGAPDHRRELQLFASKGLPRRVAVVRKQVLSELGLRAAEKGMKLIPADVPRLPDEQRVTIEDPATPAPGADAFRWFFLAGNPPWNAKRLSLGNVRALQKEFPIKLRNVYSFFTIYASIDDFDPEQDRGRHPVDRPFLDRWILSELSKLNDDLIADLDQYRTYEAARKLTDFVDALSNWYLRRSRSRFWASGREPDKIDAYATLYEVLVTLSQLAAPFVPFMTEDMYQNLIRRQLGERAPESVHLADYPEPDTRRIDRRLNEEMAVVRDIVSLGLRVRTDNRLKVRQPLAKAEITLSHADLDERVRQYADLIAEELNVHEVRFVHGAEEHVEYRVKPNFRSLGPKVGKKMPDLKRALAEADGSALRAKLLADGEATIEGVTLGLEDVEVVVQAKPGYAAAGDETAVVVLETELTPELLEEGKYRELLNRIQTFRKDLGLEYTQRIRLAIVGGESLRRILEKHREHLMKETLCLDLSTDGLDGGTTREVEIEGEKATITLTKA
ncbi:MAG TPA: isoleucine--tRNA ligase [Vicinamibacteria bacterium]|nr:isoleucine--tRNA ligase [Vicinamibacteria bacterium]